MGPGGAGLVVWAWKERDWIHRSRDVATDLGVVHLNCNGGAGGPGSGCRLLIQEALGASEGV